jgi:hypothetical protein
MLLAEKPFEIIQRFELIERSTGSPDLQLHDPMRRIIHDGDQLILLDVNIVFIKDIGTRKILQHLVHSLQSLNEN